MINEKIISFRIEPYIQEVTLQAVLDILVVAIVLTVMIFAEFPVILCVSVVIGYFAIALVLHYKVIIQAMTDKRKRDYITETVSVKSFINEFSFMGDRFGHSNIRYFYPKDMQVCRYKIKVLDNRGEEKKLRSVMSFRRSLQFAVLDKQQIDHLQVTYLKRSKILIHVEMPDEIDKISSSRKKNVVEKAIRFINMSV